MKIRLAPRRSPLAQGRWKRFCSVKRAYYSLILLIIISLMALFVELWINNRALLVRYEGKFYVPVLRNRIYTGEDFDLGYPYEVQYRELKETFKQAKGKNWVVMPLIPWSPREQDYVSGKYPPSAPSRRHILGTDSGGYDILARLVYGYRITFSFSLIVSFFTYLIGTVIGCLMGYKGGAFDLFFQRFIEIWERIPYLYIIMILVSLFYPTLGMFIFITVLFGWTGRTWILRSMTYREKTREYILAARTMGASTLRIITVHIIPNIMVVLITFLPFSIIGGISTLTALDYLGFGLPPGTPSWGDLLQQGQNNLQSPWIVSSVVTAIVVVLITVTFIGEGIQEAYNPKKHLIYR